MTAAPAPRHRLDVDVVHVGGNWACVANAEELIGQAIDALLLTEPGLVRRPSSVCMALSSDAEIRILNRDYRKQDKATNVLSFESGEEMPDGVVSDESTPLGDVVLALETILTEAEDLGIPVAHHLQHLSVHGLLHLLGYDHETDGDAAVMEAMETAALARLGIPDPYRALESDEPTQ